MPPLVAYLVTNPIVNVTYGSRIEDLLLNYMVSVESRELYVTAKDEDNPFFNFYVNAVKDEAYSAGVDYPVYRYTLNSEAVRKPYVKEGLWTVTISFTDDRPYSGSVSV